MKFIFQKTIAVLLIGLLFFSCSSYKKEANPVSQNENAEGFPYLLPEKKPNRSLSKALERNYTYPASKAENNELYTLFKYTKLKGFNYNNHDGTISRRDPSKIIFENNKYYVWYTHRETTTPPQGPDKCNDTIPSSDWDLSEIWYATSDDGFTWKEQGVAIPRPPKPNVGWRSVSTADILKWKGKYYMYYQGFMEASGKRGDDCPVAMSSANSPDGPWTPLNKIVIPNGKKGEWDSYSIHDPYPLVYKGKIYLYYKSDFDKNPKYVRMQGLATSGNPEGPFTKHALNPIISSGHETTLFPFKTGIAALISKDGNEHNTIQYAQDGVTFNIASIVELMPQAAGPFVPDAFTDTDYGNGINWGLSHFNHIGGKGKSHSILARFDCDLNLNTDYPLMKKNGPHHNLDVYFKQGLSKKLRKQVEEETEKLKQKTRNK